MRTGYLVAGIGVAIIVILAVQFWPQSGGVTEDQSAIEDQMPAIVSEMPEPASMATDTEVSAEAEPQEDRPPVVVLPTLAESDSWVRTALSGLPVPDDWLAREDLIPRLSVVIQNAAQGQLPRRQLGFLAPSGAFPVVDEGEVIFADPSGYARYTRYLDLLEKMPPARTAQLLEQINPLLVEAFALLGERTDPKVLLQAAAAQVEALPELDAPVMLVQPNVMYLYANPELESRSELDKQLLRMGPENVRRLKAYVSEFMEFYSDQKD